ncbi:PAS domain-containing sensor histidine kinase [Meridianimarinicoccus sp. RP-17]
MMPPAHPDFEDLFVHAPCGYLSLHPDGRIDRVNATLRGWTGYKASELADRHFRDLLTVAGKIYFDTHVRPLLRMQGVFDEIAFDMLAKDGARIPVLVNASERRGGGDEPVGIRVTVFRATDRRTYETELLAARDALAEANDELRAVNAQLDASNRALDLANRELRAFYETLPVGIFRADTAGRIVQASPRFRDLFGVTGAVDWTCGLAAEDRDAAATLWTHAHADGVHVSRLFRRVGRDGTERLIDMKAVRTDDPETGRPRFVGVAEDVTAEIAADRQQRQMERETAIKQLTGGLAHNLNNILAVAMGNLELIGEEVSDRPDLRPLVDTGKTAMDRAAALVARLLVYSGQSFAWSDRVEADAVLRDLAVQIRPRLSGTHDLAVIPGAPGATVALGAEMLREAMDELVANAVAGTPPGGEIRLSSRRRAAADRSDAAGGGDMVVLSVRDTGSGMNRATLEKAREPFFTGRAFGERLGLGLSLVDGIARIAGGTLRLRSAQGRGTTAELWLPAAPEAASGAATTT